MKVKTYMYLDRDEIQKNIPYMLVAETFAREIHKTGRAKRIFNSMFDESEKRKIQEMRRQAYSWALVKGVPDELKLTTKTYFLWHKLAEFCMRL